MSTLKELRAAMPKEFVEEFKKNAEAFGMTHRQLTAYCIATGYKIFTGSDVLLPLPSEPSPVAAER